MDPGLVPGTMVGEYRVEQLVGEGGMGQVYGAIHPLIGKRAAIKVLLPEICRNRSMVERFLMEARSVNQIGHPNIVDVFAFGQLPDGRQYMVMEWLRGESLSQRLRRSIPSLHESCDVLLGVAAALDAAHDKGIIHRDLKPHNVFLVEVKGARPLVKLLDFGLVKLTGADDVRIERTQSGSLLGTPAYMSPEQALGRAIDQRSDIYSLGVLAFEMLTGRLPFMEETAMQLIVAHMQQPPSLPSSVAQGIPQQLDQLVLSLLAKDPAQRPTLAQTIEVLAYFRDIAAPNRPGSGVTPPPPNFAPQAGVSTVGGLSQGEQLTARRAPARLGWKFAAFVLVLLAAAGVVIAIAATSSSSEKPAQQAQQPAPSVPADAAVVAPPADAAVPVATPPDAAPVVGIDAAVATTPPAPPPKKVTTKKSSPPKDTPTAPTKPPPPPPDDDDGLIHVTPKKN